MTKIDGYQKLNKEFMKLVKSALDTRIIKYVNERKKLRLFIICGYLLLVLIIIIFSDPVGGKSIFKHIQLILSP